MRLYLDDDTASPLLAKLLRRAGHEIEMPGDAGMSGAPDPVRLKTSRGEGRAGSRETIRRQDQGGHLASRP